MRSSPSFPGVKFCISKPNTPVSTLRTDIAGFIGRTIRGSQDVPQRVEGWRGYQAYYGNIAQDSYTPCAVDGYFENGGEIAFVHRINEGPSQSASTEWALNPLDPAAPVLQFEAKTPGLWGNALVINLTVRSTASTGTAFDLRINAPGETEETFYGNPLSTDGLNTVNSQSQLINVVLKNVDEIDSDALNQLSQSQGRIIRPVLSIRPVDKLKVSNDGLKALYQEAVTRMLQEREVSLVILPDLATDFPESADRAEVLAPAIQQIDDLHDRLLILDLPENGIWPELGQYNQSQQSRNVAAYYPWLSIPDTISGSDQPLTDIPPSGHVAGVISQLDRTRGPFYTPANAPLLEVVDLQELDPETSADLFKSGVNLLRSLPGKGLYVWGGRTLQQDQNFMYIAHRRIVHRLVRAIRSVAEALVFENNGPELWLALTRGITSVLLQAYRAGALQGTDPKEAFEVRCDDTTTSEDDRDNGLVYCEIGFAPAVPMEFIHLRIGISREGQLDILES
jgi:phage tail sheath protein FI